MIGAHPFLGNFCLIAVKRWGLFVPAPQVACGQMAAW
jgi:hypothetical protein